MRFVVKHRAAMDVLDYWEACCEDAAARLPESPSPTDGVSHRARNRSSRDLRGYGLHSKYRLQRRSAATPTAWRNAFLVDPRHMELRGLCQGNTESQTGIRRWLQSFRTPRMQGARCGNVQRPDGLLSIASHEIAMDLALNRARERIERFTTRERLAARVTLALAARAIWRALRLRAAHRGRSETRPQAHASSSPDATGGGPLRTE